MQWCEHYVVELHQSGEISATDFICNLLTLLASELVVPSNLSIWLKRSHMTVTRAVMSDKETIIAF